jgi:hypothetical protein
MTDVMIDIETLATSQNSLVLSIAAVKFTLFHERPAFHSEILIIPSMIDQIMLGRHVDPSTQDFWAKQPHEVSSHWKDRQHEALNRWDTIQNLSAFYGNAEQRVWAHGICFDISILENLYGSSAVPWKYNRVLDARTVDRICPTRRTPTEDQGLNILALNAHHPIDDCKRQIWSLWAKWPDALPSVTELPEEKAA